jgi:hypothetical protein
MTTTIKSALLSNAPLKIISLIIGYSLWSLLGTIYTVSETVQVPIDIYNVSDNTIVHVVPEIIALQISGKRSEIRACTPLALHVDARELSLGQHCIVPNEQQLLLPNSVKLLHYNPLKILVTILKKEPALQAI